MENCAEALRPAYGRRMGRATGGPKAASCAATKRRRREAHAPRSLAGRPPSLTPPSWQDGENFEAVWQSAVALMNAGMLAGGCVT